LVTAGGARSLDETHGFIAHDEKSAEALREGLVTKRLLGGDLLKSAGELAQTITHWFPEVVGMPTPPMPAAYQPGQHQALVDGRPRQQPMTPVEQYQAQASWGAPAGPIPGGGSQ